MPVLTADVLMLLVPSDIDGDTENDEDYDSDNFERGQPVLCGLRSTQV